LQKTKGDSKPKPLELQQLNLFKLGIHSPGLAGKMTSGGTGSKGNRLLYRFYEFSQVREKAKKGNPACSSLERRKSKIECPNSALATVEDASA
jgi:hypothetical protein